MKVNLIQSTENPLEILWVACRTCYSDKESQQIYNDSNSNDSEEFVNKKQKLVQKVLDSGHNSVARHVYFTFCLDGVSRACANQLERHTAGFAYSQQSLRYVEIKDNIKPIYEERQENIVEKYYVNPYKKENKLLYDEFSFNAQQNLVNYRELIELGAKPEDARGILGLNFKTNVVMSCNLQAFIHLCGLRLCTHAQSEFRELAGLMKKEILKNENYEFLSKYLIPNCKNCTDFRGCNNN